MRLTNLQHRYNLKSLVRQLTRPTRTDTANNRVSALILQKYRAPSYRRGNDSWFQVDQLANWSDFVVSLVLPRVEVVSIDAPDQTSPHWTTPWIGVSSPHLSVHPASQAFRKECPNPTLWAYKSHWAVFTMVSMWLPSSPIFQDSRSVVPPSGTKKSCHQ